MPLWFKYITLTLTLTQTLTLLCVRIINVSTSVWRICLWLFIFESTIFGTRRDNWPIKLRKQRDLILLQFPDKRGKNSLIKAEKAFKGWNQESYRNTDQDIIALPPWPNVTLWNPLTSSKQLEVVTLKNDASLTLCTINLCCKKDFKILILKV